MNGQENRRINRASRARLIAGLAGLLSWSTAVIPVNAATPVNERKDDGSVSYLVVDRSQVESLQRWVTAGHEDWCKDARLVAAKQLERIAPEFRGDATELQWEEAGEGRARTFVWVSLNGVMTYLVKVERFAWLLPIAVEADGIVWVPTVIEIRQSSGEFALPEESAPVGVSAEPISKT